MRSRFMAVLVTVVALTIGSAAHAEWLEASSPHFLIYANTSEKDIREQALDLERFDMAMRKFQAMDDTAEARANKVVVYVVRSPSTIQRLCRCNNVYGMYKARVGGAMALTPRQTEEGFNALSPRTVLFHEYAHHFLLGSYSMVFPPWFTEGFAEFMSTMTFKDGTAMLGNAAQHRAYSLLGLGVEKLSATQLFDAASRRKMSEGQVASLYARGWLLTHYLSVDGPRYKMLQTYLTAINNGTPSLTAAREAFGDLRALDNALDSYMRKSLTGFRLKAIDVPETAVTVRPLAPGAAAMMEYRIRSTYGVSSKTALPLFNEAQPVAARFPDDPVAQGWFTEIAYDARRLAEANAAADHALARDPKSIQALLYKARLLTAGKDTTPAARAEARKLIVRANRVDNNAAEPLWMYYNSFRATGEMPTKAAAIGLYRAQQLVPQDDDLRIAVAYQRVQDGEFGEARLVLAPVAYSPHAEPDNFAARVIAAIDAKKSKEEILALGRRQQPDTKPGDKPTGGEKSGDGEPKAPNT